MSLPVRLALFDFDGTLLAGNTLHLFVREQIRSIRNAPALATWSVLRKSRLVSSRAYKEATLRTLRGWSDPMVRRLGERIYIEEVRPRLNPSGIRVMEDLRLQGLRVAVVTGAFDFLVEPFCQDYGIPDLVCCRLERHLGVITGRIAGPELSGPEKPTAVLDHLAGVPVDWSGSVAFTDLLVDLPLLEMVGCRVLVGAPRHANLPPGVLAADWRKGK